MSVFCWLTRYWKGFLVFAFCFGRFRFISCSSRCYRGWGSCGRYCSWRWRWWSWSWRRWANRLGNCTWMLLHKYELDQKHLKLVSLDIFKYEFNSIAISKWLSQSPKLNLCSIWSFRMIFLFFLNYQLKNHMGTAWFLTTKTEVHRKEHQVRETD